MGTDKALLSYDGTRTQIERLACLLEALCPHVEISCRADQIDLWPALPGISLRADSYREIGPLGGILTALEAHPEHPLLVVACDLPLLDLATLEALVRGRRAACWATAFVGEDHEPEPLCALYEPRALTEFRDHLRETGRASPRDALRREGVSLISLAHAKALTNVNDSTAYHEALRHFTARPDESSPVPL